MNGRNAYVIPFEGLLKGNKSTILLEDFHAHVGTMLGY